MSSFFIILMGLAMIATLVALILGLASMAKGGKFDEKYSNKFMQARIYLQGAALLFMVLAFLAGQS